MSLTASPVKKVCNMTDMNCPCKNDWISFGVSSAAGIVVDMLIGSSSVVKKRYNSERSAEIADRRLWGGLVHLNDVELDISGNVVLYCHHDWYIMIMINCEHSLNACGRFQLKVKYLLRSAAVAQSVALRVLEEGNMANND